MKKLVCLLLCAAIMLTPCFAEGIATDLTPNSPSSILMHQSGLVLYEKNPHEKLPPASVTKVMTLLLVFEALDKGLLKITDSVTASAHACSMGGSQIWLKEGEQFTVDEMIKCVVIASANDCAVALAEHISGSEESFVAQMNARAKELSMNDTTFINACGLDATGHVTSAYDIGLMSIELMKHKQIKNYTTIWQDTVRNGAFGLNNTNKLIKSFSGITGLKTGSTSIAGFCISATAEREGLELIAVIMKAPDGKLRNSDAAALLNWGFANYAAVALTSDRPIMPIPVKIGKKEQIMCELQKTEPMVIDRFNLSMIEKKIVMEDELTAPIDKGAQIGEMTVSANGKTIAVIPIITSEEVQRLSILEIFKNIICHATMRK